jgi:hypothetical protein
MRTIPGKKGSRRRQVPRREFESGVGVLYRGEYNVEQSYYVSESGLMIGSARQLQDGDLLCVTFKVPSSPMLIVRAIVRSVVKAKENIPERYGIEFQNLEFSAKREIRNFVAATASYDNKIT